MTRLSIPDMNCGHCRASIEAALSPVPGVTAIRFEPENRVAEIDGNADPRDLLMLLNAIGFPAELRD